MLCVVVELEEKKLPEFAVRGIRHVQLAEHSYLVDEPHKENSILASEIGCGVHQQNRESYICIYIYRERERERNKCRQRETGVVKGKNRRRD